MTSTKDLRLLSLDGGGIRGLSTLLILKRVFYVLDRKLDSTWPRPLKPCQFFDLMAGSSTGGLIAIMLGALGMTIDDCITEYLQLASKVFAEGLLARQKTTRFFKKAQAKSRFDALALENEIKRLVQSYCQSDPDLPLEETLALANSCRITVCSTHLNVTKPTQLRNYSSKWEPPVDCSIWQAARATSAAPLFFDPIAFGKPSKTYGDGGLHYNNPIRVLLDESKRIWNCETERRAGIIISIGTGKPKLRGFGKSLLGIIKSLEAIVTNTQEAEEMFANEIADLASTERPHYFRFNVDQGLEDIGLEEWREFETLTEATDAYLRTHRRDVDYCVEAFLSLIVGSIKKPPQGLLLSEFPLKTDHFFGRVAELTQISDYLEASSTQKRVAIHGFPGSGKTQLALEYAMRSREHFHGCLWINAESRMSIEQSFMTCVGIICSKYPAFSELANRLEPFDVVRAWLQKPAHYPWLMIIDGLDDLVCGKRLIQYCMGLVGGTFCVTSTHQNISTAFKMEGNAIIKLGPLKPVDSRSLFLCRAQNIDRNSVEEVDNAIDAVVRSLEGFPLAIELAGVLVREGIVSLNDFPTKYQTQHQQLTKFIPGQGQWFLDKDYSLFHMFEMLYRSLSSKSACAALLLTLCSVYGAWAAPMSLFRNLNFFKAPKQLGANIDSCMELGTLAQDETTLRMAVYELHRGILAIRKQNPTTGEVENISLHGSICRWRIAYLDSESRAEWTMQASYALASHFWDSCKGKDAMHCAKSSQEQSNSSQRVALTESSNFKVARIFSYPAERCIAAIKEHVPAHDLAKDGRYANPYFVTCFYMAHMFLAVGNFEESRWLFAEAKERMHLSSEIEDSIRLLRGLAICCQQTGDLNAAKEALELAMRKDNSLEQRMDDDALEMISLLKAVRDRLDTNMDHQNRALAASLHPKQQPNQPVTQVEESDDPAEAEPMAIACTRWLCQRERCHPMHARIVANCNLWMSRLSYLGDSIFRKDEETVQVLAGIEMELGQILQESERILGSEPSDTVSLVNLLGEFSSAQGKWHKLDIMLRRESEALWKVCDEHDEHDVMKHLMDWIFNSAIAAIEAAADEFVVRKGHPLLAQRYYMLALRKFGKEHPITRHALDCQKYLSESGIYDNTLPVASLVGNKQSVRMLLGQGADVNAQGGKYGNALQCTRRQCVYYLNKWSMSIIEKCGSPGHPKTIRG